MEYTITLSLKDRLKERHFSRSPKVWSLSNWVTRLIEREVEKDEQWRDK